MVQLANASEARADHGTDTQRRGTRLETVGCTSLPNQIRDGDDKNFFLVSLGCFVGCLMKSERVHYAVYAGNPCLAGPSPHSPGGECRSPERGVAGLARKRFWFLAV